MGRDTLSDDPYIVDIDYWESDAILVWNGERHYFQFSGYNPTVSEAIQWIERERRNGKV